MGLNLKYADLDELPGCCGCAVLNGLSCGVETLKHDIPLAISYAVSNNRAFVLATTNQHQDDANELLPTFGFIKVATMSRPSPDNWIHLWYYPLAGVKK